MVEDRQDLDAVRALAGSATPTPGTTLQSARAALLAAAAEERNAPTRGRPRRQRVARRRLGLVIAAVALVGAGGAAAYVQFQPSKVSAGILCADDVAREPSGTAITNDGRSLSVQCAELWRDGTVGEAGEVPAQLTSCESGNGATYVFAAGAGVCERLGMRAASDVPSADDRAFIAFRQRVAERLSGCVALDPAASIVQDELRQSDLQGWTVRIDGPATTGRPCSSLAFDSGTREIAIVPIEQP